MAGPGGREVGRISVRVVPDTERFRQELRTQLRGIENDEIKVKVVPDVNKQEFKQRVEAALAGISAKIKVDLDISMQALTRLEQRLRNLKDRYTINIDINVDLAKLILLDRLLDRLRDRRINIDFGGMSNGASALSGGFLGLSRSGLMVVGVLTAMYPVLGLVAGLIAGLPALVAAGGLALGAVALGFDGIKEAAKTLQPEFDSLKASISQRWQDGLTPIFEGWRKYFPMLETGFGKITDSMVGWVRGFSDILDGGGARQIEIMFENISQFMTAITPGINGLVDGFLTLGAEGSKSMGALSMAINNFGIGFEAVVRQAASDGRLAAALTGLGVVLDSLLESFNRLFDAGLTAMAQLAVPLDNFVTGLTDVLVGLMPALNPIVSLLGNVLGEIGTQLGQVFQALAPGIEAIAGTMQSILVPVIQALGPLLTVAADGLSQFAQALMTGLQPAIGPLVAGFTAIADALGGALMQVIPVLTPIFQQLGEVLAGVIAQVLPVLVPMILQMVDAFVQLMTAVGAELPGLIFALGEAFMSILTTLTPLIPALTELAVSAMGYLAQVLPQVVNFFTRLAVEIANFAPKMEPVISAIGTLIGWFANLIEAIAPVVAAFWKVATAILGPFAEAMGKAMSLIGDQITKFMELQTRMADTFAAGVEAVSQFVSEAKAKFSEFVEGIRSMVSEAIAAVQQFGSDVKAVFAGAASWLVESGRALIQGFINGIKSMAGAARDAASSVVQGVRNLFPFSPAKEGPFSGKGWVLYSGISIGKAFADGMISQESVVQAAGNVLASAAKAAIDAAKQQAVTEFKDMKVEVPLKLDVEEPMKEAVEAVKSEDDLADMAGAWDNALGKTEKVVEKRAKSIADLWNDSMEQAGIYDLPQKIGEGVLGQAMSDLGMGSGSGAIPQLFKQIMTYDATPSGPNLVGDQIHYHVENIQQAMREEDQRKKRNSLQWDRR